MAQKRRYREHGTGSIYKRGKKFYFKIRIDHKEKTYPLLDQDDQPVTNRQEAEKAAALLQPILQAKQKEEIARYIAEAKKLKKRSELTVPDLWKTFFDMYKYHDIAPKTMECHESAVRLFVDWLKCHHAEIVNLDQISPDIAEEYFNNLWDTKISAVTFNKYRQSLRLVFKTIGDQAGLLENPFSGITHRSEQPTSRKEFTESQVNAIFEGFSKGFFYTSEQEGLGPGRKRIRKQVTQEYVPLYKDEMFVLLNLCCWTGCRGQDGCLMKWENVDWDKQQITYIPEKTARKTAYRSVTLPIHSDLRNALEKAKEWRTENLQGEDYILPKVAHRYLSNPSGIQKDTKKIIRCATGLETTGKKNTAQRVRNPNIYGLYSFRHTFVSFCANAGVPLDVVASIVGHGSTAITRIYAHISDAAKSKAIDALPVLSFSDSSSNDPEKEGILKELSLLPAEKLVEFLNTTKNPLRVENLKVN